MRYILHDLLGSGGIGSVHRAWDTHMDRFVALKLMTPAGNDFFAPFLEREGRLAASLSHPNIAQVYDITEINGQLAISMQLVEGRNTSDMGKLSPRRVAEIIRDASRGVQYAHGMGVIHRDLKPENLMIDGSGRVFVTDFGLAHSDSSPPAWTGPTGTPGYMSPQQVAGSPPDVRDDIYALGATLKALLRDGRIPIPLQRIITKCTAELALERFQTAGELAEALQSFLLRRRRKITLSLASAVLIGVLGALGASYEAHRDRVRTERAAGLCRDGESRIANRDPQGAVRHFTDSLALRRSALTYLFRGFAYYQLREYGRAIADCDSALELEPGNQVAMENRALAMRYRD